MTAIDARSLFNPILEISMLSIVTMPDSSSTRRKNTVNNDDFPAPFVRQVSR